MRPIVADVNRWEQALHVADAALKRLDEPPAGLAGEYERVSEYYTEMTR
jgi:hypothetical protein